MKRVIQGVLKFPFAIAGVCVVLTLFFALQLKDVEIDNSVRVYFPHKHESYRLLDKIEEEFSSTEIIGVVLTAKSSDDFNVDTVNIIRKITGRLELVEGIDEVQSLSNIDYLYGQDGALASEDLVPSDAVLTDGDIDKLTAKISDWEEMYDRLIFSEDGKSAQMMITLETGLPSATIEKVLDETRTIVGEELATPGGEHLEVRFVGDPVISDNVSTFMMSDLTFLIPVVVLVVLLSLFFSFKTVEGVVLPLVTVLMSSVWAIGLMALTGAQFTIVSTVIPVALIAVGSAYGIHVLNHYYHDLKLFEGELTKEKHAELLIESLSGVSLAVILAAITTTAGFISLITSPLTPLHTFAVFSSVGVVFSLILSMTFVPALLLLKPVDRMKIKGREKAEKTGAVKKSVKKTAKAVKKVILRSEDDEPVKPVRGSAIYALYQVLAGNRIRIAVTLFVVVIISFVGFKQLVIDTILINYFPPESQLRQDINFADKHFAGTNAVYLYIAGKEKGDMTNPEVLKAMDDMESYLLTKYEDVGKVISFTTFVKRMNQVMHIPEESDLSSGASSSSSSSSTSGLSSFADSEMLSSFSDTESASTGEGLSSFADSETLSSFADSESLVSSVPASDFVDPNIEYRKELEKTMTTADALALFSRAYMKAGGKDATVADVLETLERELNYNGMAYNEIPYDVSKYPAVTRGELKNLVSQYLLLYSGSLDNFIDDPLTPMSARTVLQLRTRSSELVGSIITDAKQYAADHFPEGYTINAAGTSELEYVMTNMIVSSQITSLLLSLLCVFLIVTITFRSVVTGLISCVPLSLTIALNYMAMGFAGINLDMFTSLIASVAVGVGIDYTIHFLVNYRDERRKSDDLEEVTRRTLAKSGKGIATNAIAVGLGFLVLILSKFIVLRYIGILVAVVMLTSSVFAMTIMPGLLNFIQPKCMKGDK